MANARWYENAEPRVDGDRHAIATERAELPPVATENRSEQVAVEAVELAGLRNGHAKLSVETPNVVSPPASARGDGRRKGAQIELAVDPFR